MLEKNLTMQKFVQMAISVLLTVFNENVPLPLLLNKHKNGNT